MKIGIRARELPTIFSRNVVFMLLSVFILCVIKLVFRYGVTPKSHISYTEISPVELFMFVTYKNHLCTTTTKQGVLMI